MDYKKAEKQIIEKKLADLSGINTHAFVEGSDCAENGIEGIGNGNEIKGVTQKNIS